MDRQDELRLDASSRQAPRVDPPDAATLPRRFVAPLVVHDVQLNPLAIETKRFEESRKLADTYFLTLSASNDVPQGSLRAYERFCVAVEVPASR